MTKRPARWREPGVKDITPNMDPGRAAELLSEYLSSRRWGDVGLKTLALLGLLVTALTIAIFMMLGGLILAAAFISVIVGLLTVFGTLFGDSLRRYVTRNAEVERQLHAEFGALPAVALDKLQFNVHWTDWKKSQTEQTVLALEMLIEEGSGLTVSEAVYAAQAIGE